MLTSERYTCPVRLTRVNSIKRFCKGPFIQSVSVKAESVYRAYRDSSDIALNKNNGVTLE